MIKKLNGLKINNSSWIPEGREDIGHAPVPKSGEAKTRTTGLPSTEPGVGTEAGTGADVGRLEIQLLNC